MGSPSEKQIAFRAQLIRKCIGKSADMATSGPRRPATISALDVEEARQSLNVDDWYVSVGERDIPGFAFMLALPDPEDSRDCSAQIDSLKVGSGAMYALEHKEWAQPILDRLAAAWGEYLERAPKAMTVREFRAVVTGA